MLDPRGDALRAGWMKANARTAEPLTGESGNAPRRGSDNWWAEEVKARGVVAEVRAADRAGHPEHLNDGRRRVEAGRLPCR